MAEKASTSPNPLADLTTEEGLVSKGGGLSSNKGNHAETTAHLGAQSGQEETKDDASTSSSKPVAAVPRGRPLKRKTQVPQKAAQAMQI